MGAAALRADLGHLLCYHYLTAFIAVISRNSVSPPELTADTPVADIVRPVKVGLFHTLRNKLDVAVLYGFYCGLNQLIHLDKPLLFYQRLNGGLTSVVGTYVVGVIFDTDQKSHLVQFFHDGFSCLITVHTFELAAVFVDGGIVIHNVDHRQVVTLSYFKVVGVMRRGNLYYAGTEFHIYVSYLPRWESHGLQ